MDISIDNSFYIVWWGSMATPEGAPDFGTIVIPVPIPRPVFSSFRHHS
jgi:hypothetical protein